VTLFTLEILTFETAAKVVEMLGLAGRQYSLDINLGGEGLRGRVREQQRGEGAGGKAMTRVAETLRQLGVCVCVCVCVCNKGKHSQNSMF
jgi:hypothetical protein